MDVNAHVILVKKECNQLTNQSAPHPFLFLCPVCPTSKTTWMWHLPIWIPTHPQDSSSVTPVLPDKWNYLLSGVTCLEELPVQWSYLFSYIICLIYCLSLAFLCCFYSDCMCPYGSCPSQEKSWPWRGLILLKRNIDIDQVIIIIWMFHSHWNI